MTNENTGNSNNAQIPEKQDLFTQLYAEYADRLNQGETLDFHKILDKHPDVGAQLVEELKLLQEIDFHSPHTPPVKSFGDYLLRGEIGRGGMGVVHDAWQNSLERRVALKILSSGLAADNKTFMRFMREAKATAQLNHPNIVHVHGMGVEENTPYYAMEYIEGKSLDQILKQVTSAQAGTEEATGILKGITSLFGMTGKTETITEDKKEPEVDAREPKQEKGTAFGTEEYDLAYFANLARSFAGVADGLHHAHSKHIVHRDIKPSNLILDKEGRLRILDFGLAHFEGHESLTGSGALLGTPLYMSPEQARGRKILIDHRTDVYSLGATLYEMITWTPPFKGKDYKDTLSRIMVAEPVEPKKLNQRIPRDLETIVLKCLRKEPDDRYVTAEAMAQDLRRFVRGDPIEARPQNTFEKFIRRVKRNRFKIGTSALFLLLLTVTLLFVHQYSANRKKIRIEQQQKRLDLYHKKIEQAVADIELGAMHLHASSGEKNRLDPRGVFSIYRLQEMVGASPVQPVERAVSVIKSAQPFPQGRYEGYYHLARAYKVQKNFSASLDALKSLFAVHTGFIPAYVLAAELHRELGQDNLAAEAEEQAARYVESQWERAWLEAHHAEKKQDWKNAAETLSALTEAIKKDIKPYEGIELETLIRRGNALLKKKDYEGALNDFIIARHAWPEAIEPYIFLGQTYYLMGKSDFAGIVFARLYTSRSEENKEHAAAWIAITCSSQLDYEEALSWAGRIDTPVIRNWLSSYYLGMQDRFEESEKAARRAIAVDPENGMSHMMLALALKGREKFEEAIASCRKAIEFDKEFFGPYHVMGMIYYDIGRFKETIEYCRKSLELKPEHPSTLSNLGASLVRMGKPEEGLKRLEKSYTLKPTALTCVFIALTIERLQKPGFIERQGRLYEEAARLDPKEQLLWRNWGILLFEKFGKTEEALDKMLKAEALNKKIAGIYGSLGMIYEELDEKEKSVENFHKAIECQKNAPWKDMNFIMRFGNIMSRKSTYPEIRKEGLSLLENATKLWPGNHRVLTDYALALTENEQYEKAHAVMAVSLEIDKNYLHSHVNLAYLYRRENEPLKALDAYFDAIKVCPPQYFNHVYGNIGELLSENATFDFGGQLNRLTKHFEDILKAGFPNPQLILDIRLFIELTMKKRDVTEVLSGMEKLVKQIPREKGDSAASYASKAAGALKELTKSDVLRFNCGGAAYTDPGGIVWAEDRFFFSGHATDAADSSRVDISGTDADALFQTCRRFPFWEKTSVQHFQGYWIPVIPGNYQVTLFFAKPSSHNGERRKFAVEINNQEVLPLYDTLSLGAATADSRTFTVQKSEALLEITFIPKRVGAFICAIEIKRLKTNDNNL